MMKFAFETRESTIFKGRGKLSLKEESFVFKGRGKLSLKEESFVFQGRWKAVPDRRKPRFRRVAKFIFERRSYGNVFMKMLCSTPNVPYLASECNAFFDCQ